MKQMTNNPILDELRQIRERMFEEAGGTMQGLVELIRADMKRKPTPAPSRKKSPKRSKNKRS